MDYKADIVDDSEEEMSEDSEPVVACPCDNCGKDIPGPVFCSKKCQKEYAEVMVDVDDDEDYEPEEQSDEMSAGDDI